MSNAPLRRGTLPRWISVLQVLVVLGLGVLLLIRPAPERWDPGLLLVLTLFAVTSDLIGVETSSVKLKLSGSFASIVVGMVVLGGGPAMVIATATIAIGWLHWREAGHYFRNNLISYATFAFATGTLFQLAVVHLGLTPAAGGFYLLIFAAFAFALGLNFVLVAGYQCLLDGSSLHRKAADALAPVLASELASAVLAAGTVYVYHKTDLAGLALVGVVVVVFQYLVRQLLLSQHRAGALERQAVTDPLTGLPNRALLLKDLELSLAVRRPHAVLLMDLDGFKEVNDTLGHDYGDSLLVVLSARLSETLRGDAVIARLGGDEFAILVHEGERGRLAAVARRLLRVLEEPVQVGEMSLEVTASIGIARYPEDGDTPHDLIRRADVAMYAAKESRGTFEFYSRDRDKHSSRKLAVLGDLRRGIHANELILEFQPQVGVNLPGVHAAESLVRWEHPVHGQLPPSEFVELAEQSGLIKPLTEHVLDLALREAHRWRSAGLSDMRVAVNLSARVLSDRHLTGQIASQLANAGVPPEALSLEITETMILDDPARALKTLERLRRMGVELSIDDFGTGYSSLAYLKHLPITEVKVDRSFVSNMIADPADLIIVRSTLDLARSLGLRTVAEGVEDLATLRQLEALRCDLAQGFHLSRPLAAQDLVRWAAGAAGEQHNRRRSDPAIPRRAAA